MNKRRQTINMFYGYGHLEVVSVPYILVILDRAKKRLCPYIRTKRATDFITFKFLD